eukprot:scaffold4204_cov140-Cylindrotheca_fusiformis.AAC.5
MQRSIPSLVFIEGIRLLKGGNVKRLLPKFLFCFVRNQQLPPAIGCTEGTTRNPASHPLEMQQPPSERCWCICCPKNRTSLPHLVAKRRTMSELAFGSPQSAEGCAFVGGRSRRPNDEHYTKKEMEKSSLQQESEDH